MVNILAFGAHPDDVELACSGTLLKHMALGYSVAVVDLTKGELGTRGNVDTRSAETAEANKILGITHRENIALPDGFFVNNKETLLKIITVIRKYQPKIILCNAVHDRHIDHGRASALVSDAAFLSGLVKIETTHLHQPQMPWRPTAVYQYIQDRYIKPDFIVDISEFFNKKMECIMAYKSQFYNPDVNEPETPISSKDFINFLSARAIDFGRTIGVKYGEGFTASRTIGVPDLTALL